MKVNTIKVYQLSIQEKQAIQKVQEILNVLIDENFDSMNFGTRLSLVEIESDLQKLLDLENNPLGTLM